ncbi:MAG: GGDEF domain-containing protein [Sulfuritalea sp.]|nr:GGDEF domain-containing protein [Sulfuritalea sp.]
MSQDSAPAVPWHRSIRFRVVAAAAVIQALMLALLVANSYRLVTSTLESQTQARLEALAPLFNAAFAGRVFQRDHSEIEAILQKLVQGNRGEFRYIVVLGPRDETLGQVGALPVEQRTDIDILTALTDQTYNAQIQLSLPGEPQVGSVRFGLSLAGLDELREKVLDQSLAIAGAALLLSLLLLTALGYLLTRHVTDLVAATRRVAQGDFSQPIVPLSRDEIGTLAEHFNRMATALARAADERSRHLRELEHLAHHDPLTRLPNRALLADRLAQAMARTQRAQRLLAIAYLDLDDFKPINDTLGHKAGDQLLVMVAKRLKEHTRADDTVCRLGGDEFVLLLGDLATIDECNIAVDRLLIELGNPYQLEGETVRVTASIGLTIYPFDDADADTLLRHADHAMYVAKQGGRNRYHLFDTEQNRLAQRRPRMAGHRP